MNRDDQQGFEFPCHFKIKAMGLDEPGFDAVVVEIIRRHCADLGEGAVTTKPSSKGKYISVTVHVEVHSRQALDAIYDDLTAHEKVLMRL